MKPWPPSSGWACVGATPNPNEVGTLVLKNVRFATPARLYLSVDYQGGDCMWVKDFEDAELGVHVFERLKGCRGLTLQQIGELDI